MKGTRLVQVKTGPGSDGAPLDLVRQVNTQCRDLRDVVDRRYEAHKIRCHWPSPRRVRKSDGRGRIEKNVPVAGFQSQMLKNSFVFWGCFAASPLPENGLWLPLFREPQVLRCIEQPKVCQIPWDQSKPSLTTLFA